MLQVFKEVMASQVWVHESIGKLKYVYCLPPQHELNKCLFLVNISFSNPCCSLVIVLINFSSIQSFVKTMLSS